MLGMVAPAAPPEVEGVAVDHRGMVFLDSANGRYMLTNVRTREAKLLPEGSWELVYAEDGGECMLVRLDEGAGGSELHDITEFLKKVVYETADGDAIVQELNDAGEPIKSIDWEAELSRHKLATASLRLHPTTARLELTCAVFVRPRALAQMAFFSLKD